MTYDNVTSDEVPVILHSTPPRYIESIIWQTRQSATVSATTATMKESSSNATSSGNAHSGGAAPVDSSSVSSRGGGRGADFAASLSFTTPSASTSPRRMTRERLVQLLDEAMHIASGGDLDGDDDDSLAMLLRTRAAIRPSCANQDGGRAHE